MSADILKFRPRHLVARQPVRVERLASHEPSLLETWPERAIAAWWSVGLLIGSALFVATMWWVTK